MNDMNMKKRGIKWRYEIMNKEIKTKKEADSINHDEYEYYVDVI